MTWIDLYTEIRTGSASDPWAVLLRICHALDKSESKIPVPDLDDENTDKEGD